MSKIYLKAGAEIDMLNKDELDESLDKSMHGQFERDWFERARGIKVVKNAARVQTAISASVGYTALWTPNAGYVWNLRFLAANLSAAQQALFYIGSDTNTNLPAINTLFPIGAGGNALVSSTGFGSGQLWLYPGEYVVIAAGGSATLNAYLLGAVEVPAELAWKVT